MKPLILVICGLLAILLGFMGPAKPAEPDVSYLEAIRESPLAMTIIGVGALLVLSGVLHAIGKQPSTNGGQKPRE